MIAAILDELAMIKVRARRDWLHLALTPGEWVELDHRSACLRERMARVRRDLAR